MTINAFETLSLLEIRDTWEHSLSHKISWAKFGADLYSLPFSAHKNSLIVSHRLSSLYQSLLIGTYTKILAILKEMSALDVIKGVGPWSFIALYAALNLGTFSDKFRVDHAGWLGVASFSS